MNLNEVAVEVTKREGGKQEQSIAQVKETIRCYNEVIEEQTGIDIGKVLKKSK